MLKFDPERSQRAPRLFVPQESARVRRQRHVELPHEMYLPAPRPLYALSMPSQYPFDAHAWLYTDSTRDCATLRVNNCDSVRKTECVLPV